MTTIFPVHKGKLSAKVLGEVFGENERIMFLSF